MIHLRSILPPPRLLSPALAAVGQPKSTPVRPLLAVGPFGPSAVATRCALNCPLFIALLLRLSVRSVVA